MDNRPSARIISPVPIAIINSVPAPVTLKKQTSFVYQDLISKVHTIQQEIIEITKFLTDRLTNEKRIQNELKSRSLTFIDPYGNSISIKYMDHELINTMLRKCKEDYIPKYLQRWIKIGTMNQNRIAPLNDCALSSTVSKYKDGCQFITYGEMTVWIVNSEDLRCENFLLRVLLIDNIEKIKIRMKKFQNFTNIELRLCMINENIKPNEKHWNEGTILKSEDTIMSCQLYENKNIIMAKMNGRDAIDAFNLYAKTLTGQTVTLFVNSEMDIFTVKELIQSKEGIPIDQQRLVYAAMQLEDDKALADYNIHNEAVVHIILRLRGGMYHFTSGRQGFGHLPYNGAEAVKNVLEFNLEDSNDVLYLSSTELQYIIKAHGVLSNLNSAIKKVYTPSGLPNLKAIIFSTAT